MKILILAIQKMVVKDLVEYVKRKDVGNENICSLPNLSNIVKGFKIGCTKEIRDNYNDFNFGWQKSFFDVIIKNDEQLEKTQQYIIDNPLKWEFDKNNLSSK